jgi:hypothetical protein
MSHLGHSLEQELGSEIIKSNQESSVQSSSRGECLQKSSGARNSTEIIDFAMEIIDFEGIASGT